MAEAFESLPVLFFLLLLFLVCYLGVLGVIIFLVLGRKRDDEELVGRKLDQLHAIVRETGLLCPLLSSPQLHSLFI